MISRPTTLILGAGASVHLGYPVGYELLTGIIDAMRSGNASGLPGASELRNAEKWDTFHDRLSMGGWNSPDAFLEKYNSEPSYLKFGKHAIAWSLRKHEIAHKLFPARDWYGRLVSQLTTSTIAEFRKNRLAIITFNYDRSVDHLLHMLAMHRFELTSEDAWQLIKEVIPIIHVHGMLGNYPNEAYSVTSDLSAAAAGIRIMHEFDDAPDDFCSPEFEIANSLLNGAEAIFALGFSMADQNMRRLRFFDENALKGRLFRAAVGSVGSSGVSAMAKRLEQFGIKEAQLSQHRCDDMFAWDVSLQ